MFVLVWHVADDSSSLIAISVAGSFFGDKRTV